MNMNCDYELRSFEIFLMFRVDIKHMAVIVSNCNSSTRDEHKKLKITWKTNK